MRLIIYKNLILASLLSLVSVGILGWLFWLMLGFVQGAEINILELKNKISSLEKDIKQAGQLELIQKERTQDFARLEKFFADKERPIEFIETLEKVAKDSKNEISISFDENKSKNGKLFFKLNIIGNETSILQYLKLLELISYPLGVENLTWQKIETGGNFLQVPRTPKEIPPSHRLIIDIQTSTP